jgi:DNA mismatch repair protein MutS
MTRQSEQTNAVVPLRRQYAQIKARFPDTILLFRLGDFYETFDDDAELAARLLDLVLTGREMGKGQRVPMAGIPYHAAEGYIARLVAAGHKVAVCEQLSEPSKGRGLVERDVTRVVTPGTVLDPTMLDARANNYIAALVLDGARFGIAAADISTGEFITTERRANSAEEALLAAGRELLRLQAAELVRPDGAEGRDVLAPADWRPEGIAGSQTEAWRWRPDHAQEELKRHFGVESLDGYGCTGAPLAISAAGGLLQYLAATQLNGLRQITELRTYSLDEFMTLDPQTRRNLELSESIRGDRRHSLIAVLDQTRTPMGARLLRQWLGQPLLDVEAINRRLDGVDHFFSDSLSRSRLRDGLGDIGDVERLANRATIGIATPRELAVLRTSLGGLERLQELVASVPGLSALPDCRQVAELLERALVDDPPAAIGKGVTFCPGFAPELDGHRRRAQEAREWIAGLERAERERTSIRSLKVGFNKVFGYYIEITTAALTAAERDRAAAGRPTSEVLPDEYLPKQTLANATRYFTPQLKEYETIVLSAQATLAEMEADIFHRLTAQVAQQANTLLTAAQAIGQVDVLATLAEVAVQRQFVRPRLDASDRIEIQGGRHPTLEAMMDRGAYVPNDAALDSEDAQIIILTGPNMAGKSSWLRQTALIVLLAQVGSFVPAQQATIGIVDRIFTRIGAQDDIASGQSTFMVEMLEAANILNHATPRSLIIFDEIGRGTSTYDGLAIARAIIEYVHNTPRLGCKTLFATHYHELAELDQLLPRVRTYKMDVLDDGDEVVFLRRVVPGGADRSYGVHVAQLAGLPKAVVRRAQQLLDSFEHADGQQERPRRRCQDMRAAPLTVETSPALQLTFFGRPHPVVEELKTLEVEAMSPIEALTKLFELQQKSRETDL